MTETKFTPGPWHACYPDKLFPHVHIGPNRCIDPYIWYDNGEPQKVTSLHALNINTTEDGAPMSEHRANASLIAEAPSMYAVLDAFVELLDKTTGSDIPLKDIASAVKVNLALARSILTRARGE